MNSKYFSINEAGFSIRCKLYADHPSEIRKVILFGHGFGGHKDNRAAEHFAERVLGKNKLVGIITFDWPCHGADARKSLSLADCDQYLTQVLDYVQTAYHPEQLDAYATSFGGYLFLKYIMEHGDPFRKMALRAPAVEMLDSLTEKILSKDELEKLQKGKKVQAGFDRKVEISKDFLEDLERNDLRQMDFIDVSESIVILQGTKDEIVDPVKVREFADNNLIEYIPIENADHRFMDPHKMDMAVTEILRFLELR
ncbi:MAG: alpha/beta fold hydrolase [Firmicutes bacterium]|nr:alpha/beta fold hydrolase [Bacillota bacterium]